MDSDHLSYEVSARVSFSAGFPGRIRTLRNTGIPQDNPGIITVLWTLVSDVGALALASIEGDDAFEDLVSASAAGSMGACLWGPKA